MQKKTRRSLVTLVLCAVALGFTAFVFAPIEQYMLNQNEMWFNLGDIVPASLICFAALTALLNLFYTEGTPVREGWIITWEGIDHAFKMILRITLLIAGTFLLTYTTSPMELTDGLEMLFSPLKKLHLHLVITWGHVEIMPVRILKTFFLRPDFIFHLRTDARADGLQVLRRTDALSAFELLFLKFFVCCAAY